MKLFELDPHNYSQRYTLYTGDAHTMHKVDTFAELEDAIDEVRFLQDADPRTVTTFFYIKDINGEVVWDYDPGQVYDNMRSSSKIQFKKPKNEDVMDEMAGEIHGGVRKALMDKGYEYLGSGIDKQAYLEPGTGQVLIIFGYRKTINDFSPDQRMFIRWINYCNKHSNNPHLPKFSGFESFKFKGKNYIQARMEALRELPDEVGYLVGHLDEVVKKKKTDYKKELRKVSQYATHSSAEQGEENWYELKDTINYLGGKQAAVDLLTTVYKVKEFGYKHGFKIDLHRGNYMARADGTIVVNDPFVLWLGGWRNWV